MSDRLLINNFNKFPHLKDEWDYEKNNISIDNIKICSNKQIHWICVKKKHNFTATLLHRTKDKTNCKKCYFDSIRKIPENIVIDSNKKDTISIGDDSETYIATLLLNTNLYKNVERIGNNGGEGDVKITHFNGNINYIQIKTLSKDIRRMDKEIYSYKSDQKYCNNILIVMVNKERTHFALEFSNNINVSTLCLNYSYDKCKYKSIMYKDIEKFKNKIIELIPKSSLSNNFSDTILKEYLSIERLERICFEKNIKFERHKTNNSPIDCFINGYSIQLKFVSKNEKKCLTYHISCHKSLGYLNKKQIHTPYSLNDFDFMIIELGGIQDDIDKYKGNFCIIPSTVLNERKILKNEKNNGKKTFSICPPDYNKIHWSKEFWNSFDILKK